MNNISITSRKNECHISWNWIKCSDRLPNVDQNVLLWDGYNVYKGFRTEDDGKDQWALNGNRCCSDPTYPLEEFTHWMEMPKGPINENV